MSESEADIANFMYTKIGATARLTGDVSDKEVESGSFTPQNHVE